MSAVMKHRSDMAEPERLKFDHALVDYVQRDAMYFRKAIVVALVSLVAFILATVIVDKLKAESAGTAGFFANWIVIPLMLIGYSSYMIFNAWRGKSKDMALKDFGVFELRGAYDEVIPDLLRGSEFEGHVVKYPYHRDALAHAILHQKLKKAGL